MTLLSAGSAFRELLLLFADIPGCVGSRLVWRVRSWTNSFALSGAMLPLLEKIFSDVMSALP